MRVCVLSLENITFDSPFSEAEVIKAFYSPTVQDVKFTQLLSLHTHYINGKQCIFHVKPSSTEVENYKTKLTSNAPPPPHIFKCIQLPASSVIMKSCYIFTMCVYLFQFTILYQKQKLEKLSMDLKNRMIASIKRRKTKRKLQTFPYYTINTS